MNCIKTETFKDVKTAVFSDETSCTVVELYRRFGVPCFRHQHGLLSETIYPKRRGCSILRNVRMLVTDHMTSHPWT
jgi:hypothetical protein